MTTSQDKCNNSSQVDRLFAEYLGSIDRSEKVDCAEFLRQHTEYAEELRELIEADQIIAEVRREADAAATALPPTAILNAKGNTLAPLPNTTLRFLGDYELLEEIAHGGMGVVYKARQLSLGRIVAIKMIRGGGFAADDDIQRFRNEAEAIANLHHKNIVAIYEVGEHEGEYYFSMNFVEGGCLSDLVREHPLPAREAVVIVKQAAEAVQHAHEQGVLHRDIKPSNILIDSNGDIQLTDFGLAKRVESDSSLTMTGQILGTPSYMPPEQAGGNRALMGPGSDVYSLGAVLCELLTGRPPFAAATPLETIRQIFEQESLSPRLLNREVPKDLETICLKCLNKLPSERYTTAQELVDEFDRFLQEKPIQARPLGRIARVTRWCRRKPLAAELILAAVVLSMFVIVESMWAAKQREQLLVDEVQRHNRSAAKWVATLVSLELKEWSEPVLEAANELQTFIPMVQKIRGDNPTVAEMKELIQNHDSENSLEKFCAKWHDETQRLYPGVVNSWYVFNKEGIVIALWPAKNIDSIGRNYAGRDYFRKHQKNPIANKAHVSGVFRSENDRHFKYAISAAIIDADGEFQGVVTGSIDTSPTLGKHKLSEPRQKVVVVGRGDRIAARPGAVVQPYEFPILIHDKYLPGQEPVEFANKKLMVDSESRSDDHHDDAILPGRWLAAIEPVDNANFSVVVQQRFDEVIPPVLSMTRSLVFWVGAFLAMVMLMIAAALSYWKSKPLSGQQPSIAR
jgi:eukaryotic-like serine/threonine-protein kinase